MPRFLLCFMEERGGYVNVILSAENHYDVSDVAGKNM